MTTPFGYITGRCGPITNKPHPFISRRYEEAVPHVNMLYLGGTIGINRIALMLGAMKPVQDINVWKRLSLDMVNRKVINYYLYNHN